MSTTREKWIDDRLAWVDEQIVSDPEAWELSKQLSDVLPYTRQSILRGFVLEKSGMIDDGSELQSEQVEWLCYKRFLRGLDHVGSK